MHRYGPHIFRTSNDAVRDYVKEFSEWRPYEHRVLARTIKGLMPIPINRTTLEMWFGVKLADDLETEAFLATLQEPIEEQRTSEDVCRLESVECCSRRSLRDIRKSSGVGRQASSLHRCAVGSR